MLHLYGRGALLSVSNLDIDPELKSLLTTRIASLGPLLDWTEYIIVTAQDSEADIIRCIEQTPTYNPISETRFGDADFEPHWVWIGKTGNWFELALTFGADFAYILLIEDMDGGCDALREMCRHYAM